MKNSLITKAKKPKKSDTFWSAFHCFYKPILAEELSAKNMKDVTPRIKTITQRT